MNRAQVVRATAGVALLVVCCVALGAGLYFLVVVMALGTSWSGHGPSAADAAIIVIGLLLAAGVLGSGIVLGITLCRPSKWGPNAERLWARRE